MDNVAVRVARTAICRMFHNCDSIISRRNACPVDRDRLGVPGWEQKASFNCPGIGRVGPSGYKIGSFTCLPANGIRKQRLSTYNMG